MKAQLQMINGNPTIVVDGRPIPEMAYITYRTDYNCYEDFAKIGVKLYSVNLNFSEMIINERAPVLVFQKGIFEHETPDFSIVDRNLDQILEACPDAYIFPRVNVNPSEAWEQAHPEELCEKGFGDRCRVSFASDVWAEKVKRELGMLIEYIENSKYADHVIGYQIAGGNTEEWLPLDPGSAYGPRAKEKFFRYCEERGLERNEASYYTFASELVATRILEFASFTKEATRREKLVGAFYGYTLSVNRHYAHHAMDLILASEDLDFLCSPASYQDERAPGIDPFAMLPVASMRLHGKLYLSENDIRTHLSRAIHDHPNYTKPIWFGHEKPLTVEQLKLNFCRGVLYGYGMWWFDMWGGWYHDDDYMALMAQMQKIVEDGMDKPICEVALFLDEKSYAHVKGSKSVSGTARALGLAGTPHDVYLTSDFERVYQNYPACVFAVPFETELVASCIQRATEAGKAVKVITDAEVPIDVASLQSFLRDAGVRVYTNRNAVVYRGESLVSLYTVEDGEYDFEVDGKKTFTDLFTGETLTFPTELPKYKCFLFQR